jgi:hypothetical protein
MNTYTISHYDQGSWIWDGNADEHGQTAASLPVEVYDLLDREMEPGEQAEVTVDDVRYRAYRTESDLIG